jgi:hypothetical protein
VNDKETTCHRQMDLLQQSHGDRLVLAASGAGRFRSAMAIPGTHVNRLAVPKR